MKCKFMFKTTNVNFCIFIPKSKCRKIFHPPITVLKNTLALPMFDQTVHLNSNNSVYHDGDGKTENLI